MNAIRSILVVVLGAAAVACAGESDDTPAERETVMVRPDSIHAGHAARDSAMDHAMHGAAPVDPHASHEGGEDGAPADHTVHLATRTSPDHAQHAAHPTSPESANGETAHAAHPAGQHAEPAEAQQAGHAGHEAATPEPDAGTPEPDSVHAAHAAPTADAAHATHAAPTADAAHAGHAMSADTPTAVGGHDMMMVDVGRTGWMAIGMAQAFGAYTMALPSEEGTPLGDAGLYLTQPAIMLNVESPQSRVSFRSTLNFEGITQPDGELTFGGWGEGFIDKRHPHTLLHEAMLSVNVWARDGGGFSLSAGKGFAPYGTDDPMSRPVLKYPTNHHLSQILERFTLNGVYSSPRWSVEVGVFGGSEPTDAYDFSNAESFANSFSTRVARRFGHGAMGIWDWELSGSYGYVVEEHDDEKAITRLWNAALRHEHDHSFGRLYYMTEASLSDPEHHDGYFSVLGEASLFRGRHNPYGRIEYATRPEYPRDGAPGSDDFFRYDHDVEPIGSTRWLIATAGYGFNATSLPVSARPYVEVSWHRVRADEGGIDPDDLFGRSSFFALSAGARVFLGGEPMRMGSYGVLDSITLMHRMMMGDDAAGHTGH